MLILPLIGGYFFCSKFIKTKEAFQQHGRERLLLHAASWAIPLLFLARLAAEGFRQIAPPSLLRMAHTFAPFPYIGTSILALVLGLFLPTPINFTIGFTHALREQRRRQGKKTLTERINDLSFARKTTLIWKNAKRKTPWGKAITNSKRYQNMLTKRAFATKSASRLYTTLLNLQDEKAVSVTLRDSGKVFAGYIKYVPPDPTMYNAHIELLVIGSGVRDKKQQLRMTNWYIEPLLFQELSKDERRQFLENNDGKRWLEDVKPEDLTRTFFLERIEYITRFELNVYEQYKLDGDSDYKPELKKLLDIITRRGKKNPDKTPSQSKPHETSDPN